ncbi:probable cytochrome P450 12a5, mitochondrial [Trichonephila inaurata madagascariensis]|uniref:Probable cytochrome P450 12a5, mitochondrial n=1 Tax=Trichonephila inaurata madagascariensis TaxID=2747483 RepID=A0A8X6X795_9ARAC|nr:probable cytochrome P450 12a5, mitochondrial [Trichonephila inaurata madagascariensis]
MALSQLGQRYLKLFPSGCKILSCSMHKGPSDSPYWHKIFKDKNIRDFDEIPTVGPVFEEYKNFKIHEAYQRWIEVGHVVKELFPGGGCCIHVYHYEDFSTVYKNDGMFPLRKSHEVIARYRRDRPHLYNSVGLGPGMGAEWAHLRQMLPQGVGKNVYMPFRPQLEEVVDDFIDLVLAKLDENSEIELLPYLFRWAFESIGVITLNRRLDALSQVGNEEADNLIKAAHLANEIIFLSNVGDFEKQYERLIPSQDYFARVIMDYVAEAALEPEGSSLVSKLAREDRDYKDITTLILDLFQGAISTVPLTLTWALYQVSRHPEIQERARKELMELMPTKDALFYDTSLELKKQSLGIANYMQYTKAIIGETLRLIPPTIGNGRIISKNLVLGGYLVPAGNMVVMQSQAACRSNEYFERPLEFIPDRYINRAKYYQKGMVDIPFGLGIRSCVGRAFANAQMNLALSKILRNFEVSYYHEEVGVINRLHNEPDRPVLFRLKPTPQ